VPNIRWRHLFRILHRDIGYTCVALTLAYGLSGIAVNHIEDWNPSYEFSERSIDIGPLPSGALADQEAFVVRALDLDPAEVRGHFLETTTTLRVFLTQGQEVILDTTTGHGTLKSLARRPVLFQVNALHLNNIKGVWTYVADVFALALMVLAVTGMVMMKGARGLTGRGKYFVGTGLLVPIGFLVYLYSG